MGASKGGWNFHSNYHYNFGFLMAGLKNGVERDVTEAMTTVCSVHTRQQKENYERVGRMLLKLSQRVSFCCYEKEISYWNMGLCLVSTLSNIPSQKLQCLYLL